jgi:DNA-binding response OmpR family regulator
MQNTKGVLVIEDDPEYRIFVTTVLAASGKPFEVRTAATLAEGLETLALFRPDVILLDLDLPDSTGYDTFLRVRRRAGGTAIILLTALDDDYTALRAAEDGVQDYLVKGLQQPKIIARCVNMALRRQARLAALNPATKLIGFIGSKGGVGTSTVAMNVAAHLAQSGDTLAIEFQPGPGTLSHYLPANPAYGLNSLLEIPAQRLTETDLRNGLVEAGPGLLVLCPGTSLSPSMPANSDHAQAILSVARQMCACAVVDLPPRVDNGVAAALRLCDSIAVIVDREASSLCSAAEMLEQIKAAGSEEDRVHLVAVDRTNPDIPVPLADIFTRLNMHPVAVIPHAASGVSRSHAAKTPLVWLQPESRFSTAIRKLTEQLTASAPAYAVPVTAHGTP